MSSKRKSIPQFSNEDEEREFWATRDSTEYIDWSRAERDPGFSLLELSARIVRDSGTHLKERDSGFS